MKLLIGTGNPRKIIHYKNFFKPGEVELVCASDVGITEQPEENGQTLEENAILKAKFYFGKSGLPTIADDAGFEIPALDNWPGINAHRINGNDASDQEIITTVLERMKNLKGQDRVARMRIVIALAMPGKDIVTASRQIEGVVSEKPFDKLEPHFPYRSLLYFPNLKKWFYEIDEKEEDGLGYRKAALEKLKPILFGE